MRSRLLLLVVVSVACLAAVTAGLAAAVVSVPAAHAETLSKRTAELRVFKIESPRV